jgi:hypothetical protein
MAAMLLLHTPQNILKNVAYFTKTLATHNFKNLRSHLTRKVREVSDSMTVILDFEKIGQMVKKLK